MRRTPTLFVVAALLSLPPASASAQDAGEWATTASLGASIFFGNTSQTAITAAAGADRATPVVGFSSAAQFVYGENTDVAGVSTVSKRSWALSADFAFDPEAPFNMFVRGKTESIFEKRIELRWNAGGGGRIQFLRSDTGSAAFSLAVLAEQTRPRPEANQETNTVAKWSSRFRYRREMADGRVTFESDTSYEPEFDDLGVFTLNSKNSFSFQLTEGLALALQFIDQYDSEAESRGARTNNDGQIFFSIVTTF